jgi:hypothetical protein
MMRNRWCQVCTSEISLITPTIQTTWIALVAFYDGKVMRETELVEALFIKGCLGSGYAGGDTTVNAVHALFG